MFNHFTLSVERSLVQNASFQNCPFSSGHFADVLFLIKKCTKQTKEQQEAPAMEALPAEDLTEVQLHLYPWEKTF